MTIIDPRLARATSPIIKAQDAASVVFDRPDLQKTVDFMADFGLSRPVYGDGVVSLYAEAGYGPAYIAYHAQKPAFRGLGLTVGSRADLERLSRLGGASGIEPALGYDDGEQVRLKDPAGFEVRAVYGPLPSPPAVRAAMAQNLEDQRKRVNEGQRPPRRPSTVLRLGHVVIGVVDFFTTARWYMDTFGLIPSDIQTIGDGDPALVFLRCDRGDDPVDHHTVVISQNVTNTFSHCAFEVIDLDDIAMGQEHLLSRGWKHAWGVGRHLLGSQIFDYWRDPFGDKVEHFCDSDQYTADHPTGVSPLTSGGLYQWGPPPPKDFETPKLTPAYLFRAIQNVRKSDEMTFARMGALKSAIEAAPRSWMKSKKKQ